MAVDTSPWLAGVLAEHADQAAYLRSIRAHLARSRAQGLADLARTDDRIDAHLDGLGLLADERPEAAIEIARHRGDRFVAAAMALRAGRADGLVDVVADDARAAISAAAWVPVAHLERLVSSASRDQRVRLETVIVHAARAHREDPLGAIPEAIDGPDPDLRAAGLRAAFAIGSPDLSARAARAIDDADATCRAWAIVISARRGHAAAISKLPEIALVPGAVGAAALLVAARLLPSAAMRDLLPSIAHIDPRRAVEIAAAWGDPWAIAFLLARAEDLSLARLAGWAVTFIAGLDPAKDRLAAAPPPGFRSGPSDSPFEHDVGLDPDARLPFPDLARLRAAVADRALPEGIRHRRGHRIERSLLQGWLVSDTQAARDLAAWDLACLDPEQPLFPVRAPAHRQARRLTIMHGLPISEAPRVAAP